MSWDYRVIKTDEGYIICEVFYDDEGSVEGWTSGACPFGDSLEDLSAEMGHMIYALTQPVLVESGSTLVGLGTRDVIEPVAKRKRDD
jgi:hypothetical protein